MIARPRGLGLIITLVLLVALPITEIWLLVQLSGVIGGLPTLGLVIAEAVAGGWLVKREAGQAWRSMNASIRAGETPARQPVDTAVVVAGGVALMFPGLITDAVGLVCLIPVTRALPKKAIGSWVDRRIARLGNLGPNAGMPFGNPFGRSGSGHGPGPGQPGYGDGGNVVPGEVVDDAAADKPPSSESPASSDENVIIRGELDD